MSEISTIEKIHRIAADEFLRKGFRGASLREIEKEGYKPFAFDPTLEHMIISGEFSAFFELIIHDISKEDGRRCVKELHDFYQAAWESVLKMKKKAD